MATAASMTIDFSMSETVTAFYWMVKQNSPFLKGTQWVSLSNHFILDSKTRALNLKLHHTQLMLFIYTDQPKY